MVVNGMFSYIFYLIIICISEISCFIFHFLVALLMSILQYDRIHSLSVCILMIFSNVAECCNNRHKLILVYFLSPLRSFMPTYN